MEDVITVKEAHRMAQEAFTRGFMHGKALGHDIVSLEEDRENMAFKDFCKSINLNPRDI